jgi:hypothetical protein
VLDIAPEDCQEPRLHNPTSVEVLKSMLLW